MYPVVALFLTPAGIVCWAIVLKVVRGVWGVSCVGGGASGEKLSSFDLLALNPSSSSRLQCSNCIPSFSLFPVRFACPLVAHLLAVPVLNTHPSVSSPTKMQLARTRAFTSSKQARNVQCRAVQVDSSASSRRQALAGLSLATGLALLPSRAWALIPDEEDEEMLEKAKANRQKRLQAQKEVTRCVLGAAQQ